MVGRRRAMVAVLAAGSLVLATGQASNGVEIPAGSGPAPRALALSGPTPSSPGATGIASAVSGSQAPSGGFSPRISADGRWVVFQSVANLQPGNPSAKADQSNVFVRDLTTGVTVQLSRAAAGDGTPQQPTSGSYLPDISADGRFVVFLTDATNIVPTSGTAPVTLVLCDRDPDKDGTFDEANANGSLTNVCVAVHSAAGDQGTPGAILRTDAPTINNGIINGTGRVAWTQLIQRPAAPGATADRVYTRSFSTNAGAISFPENEFEVPMLATRSASCGSLASGSTHEESEPVLASFGNIVFYSESFGAGGCTGIVSTNALSNTSFSSSLRYDVVPAGCGSGFLGDRVTLTGPCATFSGGDVIEVGSPSVDASGDNVVFHFHDGPTVLTFAGPRAAAPATATDWDLVAKASGNTVSSQVLSRDNAGGFVNSLVGGISGDGRYAAFVTADPGAHDGADLSSGINYQVVARDLTLDATLPSRPKGALATPRDPTRATPNNCAPAAAGQSCASAGGSAGSITMDATGGRIAFASSATDLLPAPNDASTTNVYVRTWTPTLADQVTPGGTTQTGSTKTFDVPVSISGGFGPLSITGSAIGGPDADQFATSGDACSGRVIHVNDPCTVAVRFQPTSDGTKNGAVRVTTEFGGSGSVEAARVTATAVLDGPKSAPATTVRTSVDPAGGQAGLGGHDSMVSGNGRWDVFVSNSDLLGRKPTPTGTDRTNVYVRDLADPQNTVQISLHSAFGANAQDATRPVATAGHLTGVSPNGDSYWPSISSDGRFVSFLTNASDVAPLRKGGSNDAIDSTFSTLVVCDRDPDADGVFDELRPGTKVPDYRCFSVESGSFDDGGLNLDLGSRPMLAGNGSRIAWVENRAQRNDTERVRYADLPRTAGGALASPARFTYLVSGVSGFEHGATLDDNSNVEQRLPVLNEDGSKLVYFATQHLDGSGSGFAVIEADLVAGTDQRVDGLGNDNSVDGIEINDQPALSDDGRRVAFGYYDPNAARGPFRVYVSTVTGSGVTRQLESLDNAGDPANAKQPALSGDGRYLAFVTEAPEMSNGVDPPVSPTSNAACFDGATETEFNVVCQVVARDLVHDAQRDGKKLNRLPNELVSTAMPGTVCPNAPAAGRLCGGDASSSNPSLDNTGSEVGFDSDADDLVAGDTNNTEGGSAFVPLDAAAAFTQFTTDAFVHTWRPTITSQPVDFGSVKVGATKTKLVTESVELLGASPEAFGPISLGAATVDGVAAADYKIVSNACTGTTLHEGPPDGQPIDAAPESCALIIRFKPAVPGIRTAALRLPVGKNSYPRLLRDPAPPHAITQQFDPAAVRTLTGFGATPVVVVSPATVDFGTRLPDDPLTKSVLLTNTGSTDLVIASAIVIDTTHPGAHGDYSVNIAGCLPKVATAASCVLTVTFTGSRAGIRDAVLIIASNASGGPTSVGLLARVNKPVVRADPAVSPVRRVITVTGKGFAPNHVVEVGFDGNAQITATARPNGTFVLQLVVLPNGPQGPRVLFGHSQGLDASITGRFPFLVVLGSTDPGNVIIRD